MDSKLYNKLAEPNFSDNAMAILKRRYLHKDDSGVVETPKHMLYRVASNLANVDLQYNLPDSHIESLTKDFYNLMAKKYFLPNSPTLRGAGINSNLAACFVLPVNDSRESIFGTLQDAVEIQAFGGGTGFNFSNLRPDGSTISSTKGYSRGPIPFIEIYNLTIGNVIAQGGVRQGANMGMLNYNHPDILKFIRYKSTLNELNGKVVNLFMDKMDLDEDSEYVKAISKILVNNTQMNNFNLSVGVTEEFMKLAQEGKDYDLVNHKNEVVGKLNAKEVLDEIIESAWGGGDPGIIFLDRIDRDNPTPAIGKIQSTNPCGEQPLLPYESCNLGSINLDSMVKGKKVDYKLLKEVTKKATYFLDNVIDANHYVVPEIEKLTKGNRKIGLGVMGFADMLIQLGIPYASDRGVEIAKEVMKFINEKALESSCELAQVKGPFPNIESSIYRDKVNVRNAARTTIAPTGTLSTLSDVSGGIEPIYALFYTRGSIYDTKGNPQEILKIVNPHLEEVLRKKVVDYEEVLRIIKETGSIQHIKDVPEDVKRLFLTSHEIPVEYQIAMQGAFQEHVDNAVSKTINIKKSATVQDVREAYRLAFKNPFIKGLTVYRDGSKGSQVLVTEKKETARTLDDILGGDPLPRGRDISGTKWLPGATYEAKTGCGKLFITVNRDKIGIVEDFNNMNPPGGCAGAQTATSGIGLSLGFHKNVNPKTIIKHYKAVGCPMRNDLVGQMSCTQALATALEEFMGIQDLLPKDYAAKFFGVIDEYYNKKNGKDSSEKTVATKPNNKDGRNLVDANCPECGSKLQFGEGCSGGKCSNIECGYSNCG